MGPRSWTIKSENGLGHLISNIVNSIIEFLEETFKGQNFLSITTKNKTEAD